MSKKITIALFLSILLIATFLRIYQLGNIPHGFYQDESAIGYNAYSLLKTGRDEWGVHMPLYFESFGDYKLPLYIYLTIPSILIFGMTEFAVRFPSALFGILTIGVVYFLTKKLTGNKALAFLTMGLLTINPWSLHYNRATFEVSISLFLFVLGSFLLLESFDTKKKGLFFLGTICFILSIYSYNLTRLLSPLLYGLVLFYGWHGKKTLPKKEGVITAFTSIIALIPFIGTFFSQAGVASARGTLIFSSAVVKAPLLEFKSYLALLPIGLGKVFSMPALLFWQYAVNIASYFSVNFFFLTGSTHGNHGIGNVGQFYLFELPLMLGGLILMIKQKKEWSIVLVGWGLLTILVASLTRDVPHATRSFFLIFPYEVFSAYGLLSFALFLKKQKRLVSLLCIGLFGLLILFNLTFYFTSYYVRFPILYAKDWRLEDKAVAQYIQKNNTKYDTIIFDKKAGFVYTSLLFFNTYSPEIFQKTEIREKEDGEGFSMVSSFGKYQFREINWEKDYHPKTLIVTTLDQVPHGAPVIQTFFYPTRPVVFALNQEIVSYPVSEVAYVAVEGK